MKTLASELEQTQRENAELATQIDDLKEATSKNKMMLDAFINNAAHYDSTLEQLRLRMQSLEGSIKTCERSIHQYRYCVSRLDNQRLLDRIAEEGSQDRYVKQGNADPSIQEILDAAESQEEMIFFRDSNGALWEIVKRDDVQLPEIEGEEGDTPEEEEEEGETEEIST